MEKNWNLVFGDRSFVPEIEHEESIAHDDWIQRTAMTCDPDP
jgi:hypothetical protein